MELFGLGPLEVLLVIIIAFIVLGPGKAPEIGRNIGRAMHEFRRVTGQVTQELTREIDQIEESLSETPAPRGKGKTPRRPRGPQEP